MSSEVIFSEVSHAIDLKAEITSRTQNFDCKAEVTEVIEKVNSKNLKNPRWRRRIKKHSRTSREIQFKEMNEKRISTLTDQQIN